MALIERSSNPAFSEKLFEQQGAVSQSQAMTLQGTINKSFILFGLVFGTAMYTWSLFDPNIGNVPALTWVGMIGGFILGLVTIFRPTSSPITAPIYAVLEGMFLGGISAFFDSIYPGIAIQAVSLTLAVLGVMLLLYKARIIKVTDKLRSGIIAATGAIAVVYVVSWVLSMFNIYLPMIHSSGMIGIGFSLFVVGLAAFNLLLDFDFIERGARYGAPKYMEWFSAFGLMMTLVWLYLEILRLLSKLNRD